MSEEKTAKAIDWNKLLTTGLGVILLGLQGVNLSEIGQVGAGGEKRQALLEQLLVISKDINTSLANQSKMLDHDSRSFENQQRILETLTKAIDERRDLLQQNLDELKKSKTGP